jgi:general secretion pathway protein E
MTGHLVLSTLHTNDATSAPARLLDMGVPAFLINSALIGVLAQRLVRRLIAREADSDAIRAAAPEGTLFTIQQDALQKVRDGITTIEEVLSQIHLDAPSAKAA